MIRGSSAGSSLVRITAVPAGPRWCSRTSGGMSATTADAGCPYPQAPIARRVMRLMNLGRDRWRNPVRDSSDRGFLG